MKNMYKIQPLPKQNPYYISLSKNSPSKQEIRIRIVSDIVDNCTEPLLSSLLEMSHDLSEAIAIQSVKEHI